MANEIKNENVTGLNNAPDRKVAELDEKLASMGLA